jgi:hypothetical protein
MTKENYLIGEGLLDSIEKAKKQFNIWERATEFNSVYISIKGLGGEYVSHKHMPFDIIKAIVIDAYKKELAELESEFEKL